MSPNRPYINTRSVRLVDYNNRNTFLEHQKSICMSYCSSSGLFHMMDQKTSARRAIGLELARDQELETEWADLAWLWRHAKPSVFPIAQHQLLAGTSTRESGGLGARGLYLPSASREWLIWLNNLKLPMMAGIKWRQMGKGNIFERLSNILLQQWPTSCPSLGSPGVERVPSLARTARALSCNRARAVCWITVREAAALLTKNKNAIKDIKK